MVRLTCPPFRWGEKGKFDVAQVTETSHKKSNSLQKNRPTIKILSNPDYAINNIDEKTIDEQKPPAVVKKPQAPIDGPSTSSDVVLRQKAPPTPTKKKNKDEDFDFVQTGPAQVKNARKEAVKSYYGLDSAKPIKDLNYQKYEKDEKSRELIKKALNSNDFIKNMMDEDRLKCVVEAMKPEDYSAGSSIIKEGEVGSHLYVSAEGHFDVIKNDEIVKSFGPGEAFGELAILYKAKRFASITVTTPAKVWALERRVFQLIMMKSGKQEQEDNIKFLSSVPIMEGIHYIDLVKISDFLKREFFAAGMPIVKQGEKGDKFYIIRGGTVVITKRPPGGGPEEFMMEATRGGYFGDQALLNADARRLATVTAKDSGVECLTLDRGPFTEFLGNIKELKEKKYEDTRRSIKKKPEIPREFDHVKFDELEIVGTLGAGGFGRVELVQYTKDRSMTFALKCLKKVEIIQQQQQEHVFNEKNIMYQCNSPFVCKLYKTFKDNKFLYFLMEPVLGGDVWTILQKKRYFNEQTSRFMTACVVEAFDHLHNMDIIYRDLKPENLMLDSKGYVKLVDFGYAKFLSMGSKSYTFAGTPEYVAPEIVLGKGHDKAVDYWALGVLIHEFLSGKPPFRGTNHIKTYNLILKGIDAMEFNQKISKVAQVLIKKLCRPVPNERLGYLKNGIKDIKNHKWFLGFDWDKLRDCKMAAPLIRPINSPTDLGNFEKYPKDKLPPDETSGWEIDF